MDEGSSHRKLEPGCPERESNPEVGEGSNPELETDDNGAGDQSQAVDDTGVGSITAKSNSYVMSSFLEYKINSQERVGTGTKKQH